jgi:hypothetical protein
LSHTGPNRRLVDDRLENFHLLIASCSKPLRPRRTGAYGVNRAPVFRRQLLRPVFCISDMSLVNRTRRRISP